MQEPKLYEHQIKAINFIVDNQFRAGLFYQMGLGKSLIAIEAFKKLREIEPKSIMIVLSPISIMESSWRADIEKFSNFKYINCYTVDIDYTEDRDFTEKNDIFGFNYESILQGRKRYPIFEELITYCRVFLVIDESSKIKNHKAKTTKILLKNKKKFMGCLVMSGTPAPNNETEYFPQISLIAKEDTMVTTNFYAFQSRYFNMIRGKQEASCSGNTGEMFAKGFKLQLKPKMRKELFDDIGKVAIFAKKEDCIDLPEKIFINRMVEMSAEQTRVYREINKELYTQLKNETEVAIQMAITKLMKLRQITSGFIYDNEGNPSQIELGNEGKLSELWETLEELGHEQIIIFAQFKYEIKRIYDFLKSQNKTVDFLNSETINKDLSISLFKDKHTQYLICHPKTAGMGLNFQANCSNMIWYSMSYSYAEYSQACDRIHRIGQSKSCNYIHLICKDSIDEILLKVIDKKGEAQDAIFEYLKKEEI